MGHMYYIAGVRNYLPSNKRNAELENILSTNIGYVVKDGNIKNYHQSVQAIIDKHNSAANKSARLEVKINEDHDNCFVHIMGKGFTHEFLIHLKKVKGYWSEV